MEEDESTNQNPVKKAEFLWISGEFHFGNSRYGQTVESRSTCHQPLPHAVERSAEKAMSHIKNPGPFAAPEIC